MRDKANWFGRSALPLLFLGIFLCTIFLWWPEFLTSGVSFLFVPGVILIGVILVVLSLVFSVHYRKLIDTILQSWRKHSLPGLETQDLLNEMRKCAGPNEHYEEPHAELLRLISYDETIPIESISTRFSREALVLQDSGWITSRIVSRGSYGVLGTVLRLTEESKALIFYLMPSGWSPEDEEKRPLMELSVPL